MLYGIWFGLRGNEGWCTDNRIRIETTSLNSVYQAKAKYWSNYTSYIEVRVIKEDK